MLAKEIMDKTVPTSGSGMEPREPGYDRLDRPARQRISAATLASLATSSNLVGTGCTTAEDKSQLYLVTVIMGSPAHWPDLNYVSVPDDTVVPRQLDGSDRAIGVVTGSWKFRGTGG
jgi:hypothetical protein